MKHTFPITEIEIQTFKLIIDICLFDFNDNKIIDKIEIKTNEIGILRSQRIGIFSVSSLKRSNIPYCDIKGQKQ